MEHSQSRRQREQPNEDTVQLLNQMREGDPEARAKLITRLYGELHKLASAYMRRERSDHTLQPSALINEAFLRLVKQKSVDWQSRSHFLGVAAQMMRRVLIDHARAYLKSRRAGLQKVLLDSAIVMPKSQSAELVALDEALNKFSQIDARASQVVELRFFGGLTEKETGQVLGITEKTVNRDWKVAQAWLHEKLR